MTEKKAPVAEHSGGLSSGLVRIPPGAASLSPAQKLFNKLTGQIEVARKTLAEWLEFEPQFRAEMATGRSEKLSKLRSVRIEILTALDQILKFPMREMLEGKAMRRDVIHYLLAEIESILMDSSQPHVADLEVLYASYAGHSFEQRRREIAARDLRFAEMDARETYGDAFVDDHQASDLDEFLSHLEDKLRARYDQDRREDEQAAADAPESDPAFEPQSRAEANAQRKWLRQQKAMKEASLSVREIYRKLASSLHPDREPDADERLRKTGLMQEINAAYERNDLLALLGLQMRVEQIDGAALAGLSKQRLGYYNEVLRQQLDTLESEIGGVTQDLLMLVGIYERPQFRVDSRFLRNQSRKLLASHDEELAAARVELNYLRLQDWRWIQLDRMARRGKAHARAERAAEPPSLKSAEPEPAGPAPEIKIRKRRAYNAPEPD